MGPVKKALKRLLVGVFGDTFILRAFQRSSIDRLICGLGSEIRCLDVGAGDLNLTYWFKHRHPGWQVEACDLGFSESVRRFAKTNNIVLHVTDGASLPQVPGGYHLVLLSSVLQMVPDPLRFLELCRQSLKTSCGRLVLTVPARYNYLEYWCRSRTLMARLARLVFGLPNRIELLYLQLDRQFGVQGPRGCYSAAEITSLLNGAGFVIESHGRSPGPVGTWVWEHCLLLSLRFGATAFMLMGIAFPFVWIGDRLIRSDNFGEHLIVSYPNGSIVS